MGVATNYDTITTVKQSDWVLEEYVCRLADGSAVFVYEGDDHFAAISELVQAWPCEVCEAQSWRQWSRPG